MENRFEEELLNVDLRPVQELLKDIISKCRDTRVREIIVNHKGFK